MDAGKVYAIAQNKTVSGAFSHATERGLVDWAASMIKKGHGPVHVITVVGKFEHRTPPVQYTAFNTDGSEIVLEVNEITGMPSRPHGNGEDNKPVENF